MISFICFTIEKDLVVLNNQKEFVCIFNLESYIFTMKLVQINLTICIDTQISKIILFIMSTVVVY